MKMVDAEKGIEPCTSRRKGPIIVSGPSRISRSASSAPAAKNISSWASAQPGDFRGWPDAEAGVAKIENVFFKFVRDWFAAAFLL
jgi:hypothetical protein